MTMARAISLLVPLAIAASLALRPVHLQQGGLDLPPGAERAYAALTTRFSPDAMLDVVSFMQQYWRVAANPGYNASIDHIRMRLEAAGFRAAATARDGLSLRIDEFASESPGWDHSEGSVWIGGSPTPVLSKERDRVSLAINSFPTGADDLHARLVDVGAGTAADFGATDLTGAVVLGDAPLGVLWREAVRTRGAAGVISTAIAPYIRPADPAAMSEEQRDVLQWGSVPYDEERRAFGFKASWRAANRLREALRADPEARVRVRIRSAFYRGPNRSLVAEIRGRAKPEERIVVVAHVQEPGANDNASGCATLYGMARALADAIASGTLPPPDRTITFIWLDEMDGSRHWLRSRPEEAQGVQYMFSMDMTGQDTAKTGGSFLIEKQADPTAVWPRPSDPHSEWGAGQVNPASLKGSLLNDLHIAVAQRRARETGWIVRTNPYEGGSDHTVFANAGIPSLLNWHFTDRYYHTNQDTLDKVSGREMEHVGVTVATSTYFLASATPSDALAVVELLERAAVARLALERKQGMDLIAAAADRAEAEETERQLIEAWIRWYAQALESVKSLPSAGASDALKTRIASALKRLR